MNLIKSYKKWFANYNVNPYLRAGSAVILFVSFGGAIVGTLVLSFHLFGFVVFPIFVVSIALFAGFFAIASDIKAHDKRRQR